MRYRWKTKPFRHQVAAIKLLLSTGWGGALLMEPRTGKTKVAIDYMCILHQAGKVNRVVVICPVSVIGVWIRELEAHATVKYKITLWDKTGRKETRLPPFGRDILDIVFINYEAFQIPGRLTRTGRRSRRGGRFEIRDKVRAWQPQLVVLDESHRIKSPSAKRTRMIVSLVWRQDRKTWKWHCLVPYRLILTGTVVTKKKRIFDIYSQWKFLNRQSPLVKTHTLDSFKEEYGRWTHRNGYPQWIRNQNELKLRQLMHAEAFAITRAECYDLPPRLPNQIVEVELEESRQPYIDMAEEMIVQWKTGEVTEAAIKLTQTLRLAQITSGLAKTEPTDDRPNGRLVRIGREKLKALEDIMVDQFEADQKLVVPARWRGDLASIAAMCARHKVQYFELHGGVKSRAQRDKNIEDFRKVSGRSAVFIMQPAAGALGIDLSTSATMIWYSLTNSYVDFSQSEDRIALSPISRSYIYLLAKGTVDEIMYQSLLEDEDVVKRISKNPWMLVKALMGGE